jgi:competence protein ComEC
VLTVVISSAVAGAATAPVAAAHFNQIAQYGLLANLMSVPLMGFLVMPAAVVAALLQPFGLDWLPLWVMGQGLEWILGVATRVSSWEGARGLVVTPGPVVLPLIAFGALFLVLWQGRARLAGLVPVILGFWLWSGAERPTVLVSDSGGMVGVLTPGGRALSKPRGGGFVALNWLENDGDAATQEDAHLRWPGDAALPVPLRVVIGARAARETLSCGGASLMVFSAEPEALPEHCEAITPRTLRQTGSLAIFEEGDGLRIVSARSRTGARLWSGQ